MNLIKKIKNMFLKYINVVKEVQDIKDKLKNIENNNVIFKVYNIKDKLNMEDRG